MEKDFFEKIINEKEYDFLRTNPMLKERTILLTLGGSWAYGTNIEGSDIDIRGVFIERPENILGWKKVEQFLSNETDTVIYAFNKFVKLVTDCNPNIIEMLGQNKDQYFVLTETGKKLLENKKMFLSKKAAYSFGGYAQAQLRRLQIALAKQRVTPEEKAKYISKTCNSAIFSLEEQHNIPHGMFKIKYSKKENEFGENDILIVPNKSFELFFNSKNISLGDFKSFISELYNIVRSYDNIGGRNKRAKEKSDKQLNKHAMHLIRLYLMAFDILEKQEINTYRENDRDFLLQIRNGLFMNADGTYKKEFFDMVDDFDKRMNKSLKQSTLPDKPNRKMIEEFVVDINKMIVDGKI